MQFNRQNFAEEDQEVEFMPIVPLNEENLSDEDIAKLPELLDIIALRNMVLYPHVVIPITVSREKSIKALADAEKNGKLIGVLAQLDNKTDDPTAAELYQTGTAAQIIKQIKLPDGSTTVFMRGRVRFTVKQWAQEDPSFKARVEYATEQEVPVGDAEFDAMVSSVKDHAEQIMRLSPNVPDQAGLILSNIDNVIFLENFISSNLNAEVADKQALLQEHDLKLRTEMLLKLLQTELQLVQLKEKINTKTKVDIDKQQREYFLQQQLKSIKEELGGEHNDLEIKNLRERAEKKFFPDAAREMFVKGIQKLERMHPSTPDYSVVYNHLDLLLDLPWGEYTDDVHDIKKARQVLDAEHYGMEKIKDRLLEYLAVLKLKGDLKSPILCFYGPPGIGKTTLGKSIAHALGRKYMRISLGGVHDESELRGHRKTYIGAMPGRIVQGLRKVQSSNPVFILDEIDKIGRDFRGDPSSALLEVLDPEQNSTFYDNYLELEYDLSKVLFIATANSLSEIQPALRDRMEIIDLSGYSVEEKIEIAKRHLIPKQKQAHGVEKYAIKFKDAALQQMITDYTRESGVRDLERQIAAIMRNLAMQIAEDGVETFTIDAEQVVRVLGKPKFSNELYKKDNPPGVVTGLAWTYVGGEILFVESTVIEGKGGMSLTGNLGNVMKESANAAFTYVQSHATELGIDKTVFEKSHIHIHVPEGATPKDGPSAGITMLTSLVSVLTKKRVRPFIAMTGEITLRGQVLPVGGIKEKVLAAKRAGMKEIIMCNMNEKDVQDINPNYIKGLKFHYVDQMSEVLEIALMKK
ncbi:MAG: endopeptidase La [Bacteroidota bacterium]|jgi:ATP-dependent Lon protease